MILGIDIAKEKFDVALYSEKELISSGAFRNNASGFRKLSKWLDKKSDQLAWACMEATGRYGDALSFYLYEKGHDVSVVNPARIRKYTDSKLIRNNTDLIAAKAIADFCRTQEPRLWQPPTPENSDLKEVSRRLDTLIQEQTREKNRLTSGISNQIVIASIKENISFLSQQIASLEEKIQEHIDQHPSLKRDQDLLVSIKGIGKKTAMIILSELPDISRFENVGQVVAYAGLSPKKHTSGTSVNKKTKLTKVGNKRLKTAFYLPALSAKKYNPVVNALAFRLEKKNKEKMVIVAASMKKLLQLSYGVLKSGKPFDPNYALNSQFAT